MPLGEKFNFVLRYFRYWLAAVDDHSLHPPFVYGLYSKVIQPAKSSPVLDDVEDLRKEFRDDQRTLQVEDLGAGSRYGRSESARKVSQIARTALSEVKIARLLYHLIQHLEFEEILELGTSLGITTRYMARASEGARIHTIEGSPEIHSLALSHLNQCPNVSCQLGEIDDLLPTYLESLTQLDLAYMDANHTYSATVRYYDLVQPLLTSSSALVIGDIHWSRGMVQAWNEIKGRSEVAISIDLFYCGLLFFMPYREKQHYTIRF